jgi:formylglycine-generating enzyme required for sulfatase activity
MHANYNEWCQDSYPDGNNTFGKIANAYYPNPSMSDRVLRGGIVGRQPAACRSASRSYSLPSQDGIGYGGFRVVRTIP